MDFIADFSYSYVWYPCVKSIVIDLSTYTSTFALLLKTEKKGGYKMSCYAMSFKVKEAFYLQVFF